jgi:hypothetical protein
MKRANWAENVSRISSNKTSVSFSGCSGADSRGDLSPGARYRATWTKLMAGAGIDKLTAQPMKQSYWF